MYTSKSSLEVAVEAAARVDAVLAKKGKIKPNPIVAVLTNSSKVSGDLFSTEFEINDVPLTARNLLTKGITQEEINHFSGASISTRGRYIQPDEKSKVSGGDRPLYLFIQGPNKQSLDLAIQRIDSLIREVMEQEKFKAAPPPPLMSIQTSLPGIEKVLVGLEVAPPTFDVRSKLIGPGGANLQYISNETGAVVTLRGRGSGFIESNGQESPEPLHLCVEHQKFEVLQAGRQLAFNLIETIQQEYMQTHPQHPPPVINNLVLPQGQVQTLSLQPGEQLAPGMVATSIAVPVFTQQPMGQVVNVPPPSMAIPPPQLLQQPPPSQQIPPQQLALPPPGVHIPPHQGPLVPPQQGIIHQHQVLQQPPPNIPPPGTVMAGTPPAGQPSVSVAQPAQHTIQQQVIVSQGGSIVTHPPPTMTVSTGHQVLPPNSMITTPTHQPQAFITHATYPVQYIQANGQTLMAYPGVMRQDGQAQVQLLTQTSQGPPTSQAHLVQGQLPSVLATNQPPPQTQIQPGVVLQTGQTQQIQLAQLMQSHLINQAQPQAVTMLLQYQQQQGINIGQNQAPQGDVRAQLQQTRLGSAIVQGHQRLATPVQIQLQSGQQMQVINPQVQLQQPGAQQPQLQTQPGAPQIQYQHIPPQQFHQQPQVQQVQIPGPQPQYQQQPVPQMQQVCTASQQQQQQQLQLQQQVQLQQQQQQPQQVATQQGQHQLQQSPQQAASVRPPHQNTSPNGQNQNRGVQIQNQVQAHLQVQQQSQVQGSPQMQVPPNQQTQSQPLQQHSQQQEMQMNQVVMQPSQGNQQQQQIRPTMANASPQGQKRRFEGEENKSNTFQGLPQPVPPPKVHSGQQQQQTQQQPPARGIGDASGNIGQANSAQAGGSVAPAGSPASQPPRDKQLMPPPPPPQGGVPDDWQNSQNEQQMKQVNRGDIKSEPKRGRMAPGNGYELERDAADNRAVVNRNDRPTFNHYSSKPQMYNANIPFHMHGLGMYPPPPPPPPPPPGPSGQYPYYQQPQQHPTHHHTAIPPQYPYWMMPQ